MGHLKTVRPASQRSEHVGDPMSSKFGGIPFEAAPEPSWPFGLPTVAAHSSYWAVPSPEESMSPPTFTP